MIRISNFLFLITFILFSFNQSNAQSTEKVWRVNFLNPALELELPTGEFSTFSTGLAWGILGAIPN